MRISCPSCSAAYEIPDHVLGKAGRTLRCARCGTEWAISVPQLGASAEAAAPEPELVLPPRLERMEEAPPPEPIGAVASHAPPAIAVAEPPFAFDRMLGAPQRATKEARHEDAGTGAGQPGTPASVWLGWVGTIILLVVLVWCGYVFRTEVMHVWPASERLYALLGMAPVPQ